MMCCGVIPIDTMKDYISPISLIVHRVPKDVIEALYKIKLPEVESKKYNASVFLQVYAAKKGYVTGRGLPNEAYAARLVLKDYVNGKLLFVHLRPDFDKLKHGEVQQSGFGILEEEDLANKTVHPDEEEKLDAANQDN